MKVFGIGLNKTGTTTLDECGKVLGYRVKGCDRSLLAASRAGKLEHVDSVVEQFDLFQDWPWPLLYKYLDVRFPGSKFILTTRGSASIWLESLKKHSMRTGLMHCRKMAYGYEYPHQDEASHLRQYDSHNQSVREYFFGRSEDFLEVCWESGDGWDELCAFLGKDVPDLAFPHANKSGSRAIDIERLKMNRLRLEYLTR